MSTQALVAIAFLLFFSSAWSTAVDKLVVDNHDVTSVTLSVTLSTATVGSYVSGTWSASAKSSSLDWIGLYRVNDIVGDADATWWVYVSTGVTSGTFVTSTTTSHAAWKVSVTGGSYVFKYFCCDGYTIYGQSNSFTVLPSPTKAPANIPTKSPAKIPSKTPVKIPTRVPATMAPFQSVVTFTTPTTVSKGSYVVGSWKSSRLAQQSDWIGLFTVGDGPGSYLWYSWISTGSTSGSFSTGTSIDIAAWTVPAYGGPYEFRYFCCDSWSLLGKSKPFTVLPSPTAAPVVLRCRSALSPTTTKIKHLIVIISENHSFDAYFGGYCKATAGSSPTCNYGPTCCEGAPSTVNGKSPVVLTNAENVAFNPCHDMTCELCEINGGLMNKYMTGQGCSGSNDRNFAVGAAAVLSTYHSYARKYAIADRFFQSAAGASSMNDMYFARGHHVFTDNMYGPANTIGSKCWPEADLKSFYDTTIVDLLVKCNVDWSVYIEGYNVNPKSGQCWPNFYDSSDIPFAYYPSVADNPKYFKDYTKFFTDVDNGALPSVSYFKALGIHSEHPDFTISAGQTFSDSIVQKILKSKLYSNDTLIIILPDESGGYYDHVSPPATSTIDGFAYGPRTPFIAIGNMVKKNYISHVQMEVSSLIKFIEYNWLAGGTGQLRTRDLTAKNIGDLLDPVLTGVTVPSN